jgi:hypothetical protein
MVLDGELKFKDSGTTDPQIATGDKKSYCKGWKWQRYGSGWRAEV